MNLGRHWRLLWFRLRGRNADPLGRLGERAAEKFLRRAGYKIIGRGLRFGRGELDLIAVDGRTVVFVEVKTRTSTDRGTPAEAVDAAKQVTLTRSALLFLKRHGLLEHAARFDVVSVLWPAAARRPSIEHVRNAFEPTGAGQMFS